MDDFIDYTKEYLKKISKIPLLTDEEVIQLAKQVEEGNEEAINKFTEANLRLVVYFAQKYDERGLPLDDLIQEGNMALREAVLRFDYKKGNKFSTYASILIENAMKKALEKHGRVIRLPSNVVKDVNAFNKAVALLSQKLDREPVDKDISEKLNISLEKVRNIRILSEDADSLDKPTGVLIEDDKTVSPEKAAEYSVLKEQLYERIQSLNEKEQRVIILRFGLEDGHPRTLVEIGLELNISSERVRQIEAEALRKLKSRSTNKKTLRDFLDD